MSVIRSFKDRNTRRFFEGHRVAAFQGFAALPCWRARRKLATSRHCRTTVGVASRRPRRPVQHSDQRTVARLLQMELDGPCDVEIVDYRD